MLNFLLVVDYISNFIRKINNKYFIIFYLLKLDI